MWLFEVNWNIINICSKFVFFDSLFLNFFIGSFSGGCVGLFCVSMIGGGNFLLFLNFFI